MSPKTDGNEAVERRNVNILAPPSIQTGTGAFLGLWSPSESISSDPPAGHKQSLRLSRKDIKSFWAVIALASVVRFWGLRNPPNAVFEEPIMGGYINRYFQGNFFLDFEPPLPGIVYYFLSKLFGYRGSFVFKGQYETFIGEVFPFAIMRGFAASLGVASVAMGFLTLKLCGVGRAAAVVGACMVAFENSLVTEHRYMFPQPIFLCLFTACVYLWKRVELELPFSKPWWKLCGWLGILLGCAASTRNAGGALIGIVWMLNMYQTWWTAVDLKVGVKRVFKHFLVRTVLFALVPILIYTSVLVAHLKMTPVSGDGDTFMPGAFQANLINNERPPVAANVSLGGLITIRHYDTHGFLHSHDQFYPRGSGQQQVSLYGYRDLNNVWMVDHFQNTNESYHHKAPEPVFSNQYIRLKHVNTNRHLHSHDVKAPVSENDWQFEVSAYGADGYPGDLNDLWRLEVIDTETGEEKSWKPWQAIRSVVRLQHAKTGCWLFSHDVKLPQWGSEQQEVTCATRAKAKNTLWVVETHYHPYFNSSNYKDYVAYREPTWLEIIAAYTEAMTRASKQVNPSPIWQVPTWKLPFLTKGSSIYWHNHRQVFVFGNLFNWHISVISIALYIMFKLVVALMVQRGYKQQIAAMPNIIYVDHNLGQMMFAWLTFYLFLVCSKDDANIIDYLPALYLSLLGFAQMWDYLSKLVMGERARTVMAIIIISASVWPLLLYAPLAYGREWTSTECNQLELNKDWGFHCENYLNSPESYRDYDKTVSDAMYSAMTPREEPLLPTIPVKKRPEGVTILDEFSGIDKVVPQQVDLGNPHIRQLLTEHIHARGMSLRDYEDNAELDGPDANNTEVDLARVMIAEQWGRVTDPPTFANNDALARQLGLATYNEALQPESVQTQASEQDQGSSSQDAVDNDDGQNLDEL